MPSPVRSALAAVLMLAAGAATAQTPEGARAQPFRAQVQM